MENIFRCDVAQVIFSNLSVQSLANCRRVSKTWQQYLDTENWVKKKNILYLVNLYDGDEDAWKSHFSFLPEMLDYTEVIYILFHHCINLKTTR